MTLLVRDEEDIIRENIEFHKQQGVDFFIVTDNRSVDRTPEILKAYEKEGILKYKFENSNDYNQAKWVTEMAREAYTEYGADWVINNDADEFWFPKNSHSLKAVFETIDQKYNVIIADRYNFIPIKSSKEKLFYETMIYREKNSKNPQGDPLPPKVAHRGDPRINVSEGNHDVSGIKHKHALRECIEIFHFPIRHKGQYEKKMIHLGSGYDNRNFDNIRRDLYKDYLNNQDALKQKYDSEVYTNSMVYKQLLLGEIKKDVRLRNALLNIKNKELSK